MDVLLRLRVLIWVVVISLWGMMVYQYLGEEEQDLAKMKRIAPYGAERPVPLAPPPDQAAGPSSACWSPRPRALTTPTHRQEQEPDQ